MIRRQGPLRAYSTRSMERVIGKFSKLINSKTKGGRNASNLVEKFAVKNYLNATLNLKELLNPIAPESYSDSSYIDDPNDSRGAQLWEPFEEESLVFSVEPQDEVEGVTGRSILKALQKYYIRNSGDQDFSVQNQTITVAARLWKDSTIFGSNMYRRINRETSRGNHLVMFTSYHRT